MGVLMPVIDSPSDLLALVFGEASRLFPWWQVALMMLFCIGVSIKLLTGVIKDLGR